MSVTAEAAGAPAPRPSCRHHANRRPRRLPPRRPSRGQFPHQCQRNRHGAGRRRRGDDSGWKTRGDSEHTASELGRRAQQMEAHVYYPGVQTIDSATSVALAAGEDRPAIDFSAPALKPVDLFGGRRPWLSAGHYSRGRQSGPLRRFGSIRGRVLAADGRARRGRSSTCAAPPPAYSAAITDAEGRFEFRATPSIRLPRRESDTSPPPMASVSRPTSPNRLR
jgi:hypothetical protein